MSIVWVILSIAATETAMEEKKATPLWAPDVTAVETAVGRFRVDRGRGNDCQVVLFEMLRDWHLRLGCVVARAGKGVARDGK